MEISNIRSDYIILTKNIIDSSNVGTNLYIKTGIIDHTNNTSYDISWQNILNSFTNNYKNRIILSGKIKTNVSSSPVNTSCCLITKNNIKNNMKFIYDSSINTNGKILFVKNLNILDNSVNYLFDDLSNTYFENNSIKNLKNTFNYTSETPYNRFIYNLNYYFSDSDFYKINIKDYMYKYAVTISNNNLLTTNKQDISYTNITYNITNIVNDFSFINTTIDSSSSINFDVNNFRHILIDNSNSTNFISDNSLNKLVLDASNIISIYRNIWSYNRLTLDFKHVNYYTFKLNNTFTSDSCNNTIKTFLIKTNNFGILQNIKTTSKIIFGYKNIYLNNIKVLDITSNLYNKPIRFNGRNTTLRDASNLIFLRLDKQLTGITQHDIYNHVHFYNNKKNNLSIRFVKDINVKNITTNSRFTSLMQNLNKYYLLDISLNNNNNNNINNINNTINFNNILFNNVEILESKVMNLNFNSYFDVCNNNYLKNSFNNLARINNKENNIFSISNELVNSATYIQFKDIRFSDDAKLLNRTNLEFELIPKDSDNGYDLRYNYNIYFFISNNLNLLLNYSSLNLTNNFLEYSENGYKYSNSGYSILNFYKLIINNLVQTTRASDFTNVDCVYIYHDPINDPDPQFRYPNNNIEIKFDKAIDTLTKAIEQYRGSGARTSTTNSAFIPAQNGSNFSRKMIQGIIGLNNIPKLLSIEPYDPNFINGRGFLNQYQINDACITSNCDKIAVKQNAIKHDSVKNNRIYASNSLKKQNFANAVRSSAINKLSQECIKKRSSTNPPPLNPPCNETNIANITLRYTPMTPRTTRSSWRPPNTTQTN